MSTETSALKSRPRTVVPAFSLGGRPPSPTPYITIKRIHDIGTRAITTEGPAVCVNGENSPATCDSATFRPSYRSSQFPPRYPLFSSPNVSGRILGQPLSPRPASDRYPYLQGEDRRNNGPGQALRLKDGGRGPRDLRTTTEGHEEGLEAAPRPRGRGLRSHGRAEARQGYNALKMSPGESVTRFALRVHETVEIAFPKADGYSDENREQLKMDALAAGTSGELTVQLLRDNIQIKLFNSPSLRYPIGNYTFKRPKLTLRLDTLFYNYDRQDHRYPQDNYDHRDRKHYRQDSRHNDRRDR
uniref:Velvet domain-containing protein n=1 Tax=Steinernema glaseri TaxID=37863 RepID=A0A1I7ZM92_9BILA